MSDSSAPAATSAAVLVCCRCNKSPAAKCGLCKAVAYCGKACQAKDWELGHKARCKELRKEAAAAAAAGAGDLAAANSAGKSKSSSASASALAPPPSSSPAPLESTDLDSSPSIDLARPSQWLYAPPSLRDLFDPRGAGALTIPRRPVGLRNPKQANSCFLNVVLQSLTYTAPLANWLETLNHARDACVVSKSGKYCALCALDSHHHLVRERYAEALTARSQSPAVAGPLVCKPILPVEILKNLSALNSDYMLGQQEDSHQTTEHLLHLIDESWRKNAAAQEAATAAAAAVEAQANAAPLAADASAEGSDSSSSSSTAVTPSPAPAPASSPAPARPLSQRTLETTPISQLFGGYLLSQLKCGFPDCNRVSSSFEHFLDLSLELIEATDDLGEMLEAFSRIERLDERNKWKCGHCHRASRALKKISLFQPPNILMIQLKRFRGGMFGKVNKSISFPAEISLRKYMSECVIRRAMEDATAAAAANGGSNGASEGVVVNGNGGSAAEAEFNTQYRLYAVIVHLDLLAISSFGHYICYVRGPPPLTPSAAAAAASSSSSAAAAASLAVPSAAGSTAASAESDWFKIDDDEVTRVSEKTVLAQKAYILFYQRNAPFIPRDDVAPPEPTPSPATAAAAGSGEEGAAAAASGSDVSSTSTAAASAASSAPVQCVGGCGFWGSLATESMCSSCYRKAREDRGEIPRKVASPAPQASYEKQSGQTMEALRSRLIAQRVAEARAQQDAANREKALALMTAKIKADAEAAAAAAAEDKGDGFYKQFGAKQRAAQAEAAAARARAAEAAQAAKEAAAAAATERRLAEAAAARQREEADLAARLDKARITEALKAVAADAEAAGQATKQCSACHQWQVVDLYTNAQLKKQGKRVCTTCVEKKAAAAAAAAASKQTPAK